MVIPVREGDIDAGGFSLHYYRSGGDGSPLVLAHGFSDNGLCWASLLPTLAGSYDVVAYDARAHGSSEAPDEDYTSEDQGDDLLALIDGLGLEQPILMGHSMGGLSAGWAEVRRPGAAAAVIFEDSGVPMPRPEDVDAAKMRRGMNDWISSLATKTVDELIAQCRETSPDWPEEDLRPWAESKLQLQIDVTSRLTMVVERNLKDYFPHITCPVLFLKADAPEEERQRHRDYVATFPNARIEHVAGAGHNVRRDRHRQTVAILEEFLAGL